MHKLWLNHILCVRVVWPVFLWIWSERCVSRHQNTPKNQTASVWGEWPSSLHHLYCPAALELQQKLQINDRSVHLLNLCFTVCHRLRDGSEYLLSASSRFMMRKWILRIQEHAGIIDSGQYADECQSPVRSYVTSAVLAQNQATSGRSKEIIVHTGEGLHVHQRHQELLRTSSSHAGHSGKAFLNAILNKLYCVKNAIIEKNKNEAPIINQITLEHTHELGEIHTNCLF